MTGAIAPAGVVESCSRPGQLLVDTLPSMKASRNATEAQPLPSWPWKLKRVAPSPLLEAAGEAIVPRAFRPMKLVSPALLAARCITMLAVPSLLTKKFAADAL